MSLADYLAKNYLTADPKPDKKSKKRKRKEASSGLIIADDDSLGWEYQSKKDDDDGPTTISGHSAEFRRAKSNNWQTLGGQTITQTSGPTATNTDEAAANAIIALVASEKSSALAQDEDAPAIAPSPALKMESGAHAGLQSASSVTTQLKNAQEAERQRFLSDSAAHSGKGQETVFRDASGRRIDIGMKRAEARNKAEVEAAKAAAKLEAQKGDVQLANAQKSKEQLREAKFLPVARYADDEELNNELKERERWDDPGAQFISKKEGGRSVSGKPLYKGPAMPNRYGIRPGHRWDGVDRGNGFEKEYFAAKNRRRNLKELDYAWQMDE